MSNKFSITCYDLLQGSIKHGRQTYTISERPCYFTPINITYGFVYLSTKHRENKLSERYLKGKLY